MVSMNIRTRFYDSVLADHLASQRQMAMISGPRQVGKTTLAKKIIAKLDGRYLVYDDDEDRRVILQKGYLTSRWVCLDAWLQ